MAFRIKWPGATGCQPTPSLSENMRGSSSKTRWSIRAGGVGLILVCAAVNFASAGDERRAGPDWWSFQPLRPVAVPRADDTQALINPIDNFLVHRLQKERLEPSPSADRPTLIRRL